MTTDTKTLQTKIEQYFAAGADAIGDRAAMDAFLELRSALSEGRVRAAEPDPGNPLGWRVNAWVKQGILLGFRLGTLEKMGGDEFSFVDKNTYPARRIGLEEGVRVVPGGSTIREGAYLARGVVCMPPMYVNAGAYVDEGTMVDSHALVGSCAQIGKRVHLSAAAQIGGVLEPVNATRDHRRRRAGRRQHRSLRGHTGAAARGISGGHDPDPGHAGLRYRARRSPQGFRRPAPDHPGRSRGGAGGQRIEAWNRRCGGWGLSLYTPVIVKYRDDKTDLSSTLGRPAALKFTEHRVKGALRGSIKR